MNRREVLGLAAGAFVTTAGCTAAGTGTTTDSGSDEPGADPTRTDEAGTTDGVEAVETLSLQPGLIVRNTPDSITVRGGKQYLFLIVQPGDAAPVPSEFTLAVDDGTHAPVTEPPPLWRRREGGLGPPYSPDAGGWLLFELPQDTRRPTSPRLTWPGGSWSPTEAVRRRIAAPAPTFDVSVSDPGTVPVGEAPEVTVTATNTAERTATFLLAVNRSGPMVAVVPEATAHRQVEPGATTTWTHTPEPTYGGAPDPGDEMDLRTSWPGGSADRTIEFVPG